MSAAKPANRRQGNRTKATEVEVVPSAVPEVPTLPVGLKKVADLWDMIWLEGGPVFSPKWDRLVVEQLCWMSLEILELQDALSPKGNRKRSTFTAKGSKGQTVLHPLRKQLDDLRSARLRVMRELGMTPDARAKLGISWAKQQNDLDEFLAQDDDEFGEG